MRLKEITALPDAVGQASADMQRASAAVVEAGEAATASMIAVAAVALLALAVATVALVVVRRAA